METLSPNSNSALKNTNQEKTYIRRWYDEDPELSNIVLKLEYATDETRNKIAMLIIKTIIDRNIMELKYDNIDSLIDSIKAGYTDTRRSRWYDTNSTTRTAMQMLYDLPCDSRASVALEIKESHKYICIFPI